MKFWIRTKLPRLNFGGAGMHSHVEVQGERRKSPRLAAKQNDTTHAMKNENENSKLQKKGVRFQTESQHNLVNLNPVPASGM
jgi:hypothetical protein